MEATLRADIEMVLKHVQLVSLEPVRTFIQKHVSNGLLKHLMHMFQSRANYALKNLVAAFLTQFYDNSHASQVWSSGTRLALCYEGKTLHVITPRLNGYVRDSAHQLNSLHILNSYYETLATACARLN